MSKMYLMFLSLICLILSSSLAAQEITTDYSAGYAKAVLEYEFNLHDASVLADNKSIIIRLPKGKEHLKDSIRSSLDNLPAATAIRFEAVPEHTAAKASAKPSPDKSEYLPDQPLFDALMADPRWPHFSMAYQRYLDQDDLENVGHTSFGESFVFYRRNSPIRWEFGMQAGVFALFDLDADSYDLINADYRVSIPVSLRWQSLSAMFRVLHQSSHLGDEFILRGRAEDRENLSYEKFDTLFSIDLPLDTRLYGGGGYIFHKDPSDLEPWSAQGGLEWVSQFGLFESLFHPLAAVDVQSEEENDWDLDLSVKTGLQLGSKESVNGNRLQFTLEYYQGHSPNGQFYNELIEYVGLGLHYYR